MPKKILFDTDPGIDDACAILLALASPELSLEGLSVIHGNCSLDQGTTNALSILELANASHIPVAKGCELPLVQPSLLAPETHGDTGLGYAKLPNPQSKPISQHGIDFLIETILAAPGEITLVAIAPLTNVALAIRKEPRIVESSSWVERSDTKATPLRSPNSIRTSILMPHKLFIRRGFPPRLYRWM